MANFSFLETERLLMEPLKESDAEAILEYQSDPEVVRYVPWPVRDLEMVRRALADSMKFTTFEKEGDYLVLGLYRKDDRKLIGQMNAMYRSKKDKLAEFGYVLNPRFSGNGYATEASATLVTALFESGRFHRVIAKMDARNTKSAKLCERLGMRREAHHLQDDWFKEEWTDTFVYATLKSEWLKG